MTLESRVEVSHQDIARPRAWPSDCPTCRTNSSFGIVHRFEEHPHYVLGCDACGVQTIYPKPTIEELKEFYLNYETTRTPDEQMPVLIERSAHLLDDLIRNRMHLPSDLRTVRYLEAGFGSGASLLAAAQLGMQTFGFDLDPHNVSDVSRRAKSLGLSVHVQCGDANLTLDKGETFDFIKASQLIEHLIDPIGFVDSMSRFLSCDGYLYLECPNNSASFLQIKNRLRRRFGRMDFYNSLRLNQHLWGFNRASMTELLRANGFDIVFCRDYPVRHRYIQPENLLWYPSLMSGVSQSFSRGQPYALLKSLIPIFDHAASVTLSGGSGLAALGRKHAA